MAFTGDQYTSSSSMPRYPNRVFLSFRGVDTRLTFTGHLYTSLINAGINTFKDDIEITRGEKIKSELEKGIQQSSASLIVFSEDYASSSWCLDELAMIIERRRVSGHLVLPLFYHVNPIDVRRQTGSIGEAFAKYEKKVKTEANPEKKDKLVEDIKKWRAALKEAADISGMQLKIEANGDESKFIQQVVDVVQSKLRPKLLDVDPHLVGMPSRMQDISLWIQDATTDASIMLICGMGGIGKTTIAKKVYNENYRVFDGCSFLSDIRERLKDHKGVLDLQKQLLSDICNRKNEEIHSVDEGIYKIRDALCFKKVLLVLDDVDHVDQLKAILKMQDSLFSGSKIIVTSRNEQLKHAYRHCKVHEVITLSNHESVELFSLHAFRQRHPTESYMEHLKKIVSHCGGLPLALQVLGSSLYKKKIDIWESLLKKLDANPHSGIVETLKISFDCLKDDDVKNVFLHIACFFVGEDKNCTIEILDACEMSAVHGIDHLVDLCLLKIDSDKLTMHQLIKDMGRYIVRMESPDEPGERSRLWRSQDCVHVLREQTGTRKVKALAFDMQTYGKHNHAESILVTCKHIRSQAGADLKGGQLPTLRFWGTRKVKALAFDMQTYGKHNHAESILCRTNTRKRKFEEQCGWFNSLKRHVSNFLSRNLRGNNIRNADETILDTDAFESMPKLMFLKLSNVELSGRCTGFPTGLRWFSWHRCNFKCMPSDLSLSSLVCLEMKYSSLKQLWKGSKFLPALKILDLSHSMSLASSPHFSGMPNLERLILEGCAQLVEVCESIESAEGLVLLNLKDCKRLRKLPRNLSMLLSLEELIISGCSSLSELPMGLWNCKSLKKFDASRIDMNAFVSPAKGTPSWAFFPQFIEELSLKNCQLSNDCFPKDMSNLSLLKKLYLGGNMITSLPDCCGSLENLVYLDVDDCSLLQSVVGLPITFKRYLSYSHGCYDKETIFSGYYVVPPSWASTSFISYNDCPKLAEIEGYYKRISMREVERGVIKKLGLMDLEASLGESDMFKDVEVKNRCSILTTFVQLDKLPGCFNSISLNNPGDDYIIYNYRVTDKPNNIRGLTLAFLFSKTGGFVYNFLSMSIINKTKNKELTYRIDGDWDDVVRRRDESKIWVWHLKVGTTLQLQPGDFLTFRFDGSVLGGNYSSLEPPEEFGVMVVYKENDDDGDITQLRNNIIPFPFTGQSYYLSDYTCHRSSSFDKFLT